MTLHVLATTADRPKSILLWVICLTEAFLIGAMVVAQLFTFEKFPDVLTSLHLPGGLNMGTILASLIVVAEVFSLPFLLSMTVSPLMRIVSMVCGLLVASTWLGIALCVNITVNAITNVGLLGAAIKLPTGGWMVVLCVLLFVLALINSWSLWPLHRPMLRS